MRAILFLSGTCLLVTVSGLMLWRPAMMLGLAILGGAINLWRMHRPHKASHRPAEPKARVTEVAVEVEEPVAAPEPVIAAPAVQITPSQPYADLLARIRAAGWAVHAAKSPFPWLIAVSGGARLALRPRPMGAHVTAEDLVAAMAAREADGAQLVAIICAKRPTEAVANLARECRIHIVNPPRLEAYLALALSFKSPAPRQAPALRGALAV